MPMKDTLYKFRSLDNEYDLECLTSHKLFYAKPNQLNDPHDLKIDYDFSLIDTEEKVIELAAFFYKGAMDSIANGTTDKRLPKFSLFVNFIRNKPSEVKEFFNISIAKYDEKFGVICFSKNCMNTLLWSHYGGSHKGMAIGFKTSKLGLQVADGLLRGVDYNKFYHKISPIDYDSQDTLIKKLYSKSIDWEYENEVRIVKIYTDDSDEESRYLTVPLESIEEVVLGMYITQEHQDKIIKFCSENGIKVYKIEKQHLSFELTKKLIIRL